MTDSHLPASNRNIMVVDDEQEMVKVVRGMLEEKGFNVRCAYDGTQVFDFLKQ
jgi:CheY-like chemotaxis protein